MIILFISLFIIYRYIFYSPAKGQNEDFYSIDTAPQYQKYIEQIKTMISEMSSIPYEDVVCMSYDFKKLHGRLYRNEKSNKIAICFHGYRGTPNRDFSGGGKALIDLGLNVLLIEERAHCKSESHSITFGHKEKRDVLSWITLVKQMFGENIEIYLFGISMGASTVLFASEYLDERIKICADCPYSTQKEILQEGIAKMKLPKQLLYPFVVMSSFIFAHTKLNDDASIAVRNSKCKILIIHGTNDSVVPHKFSERIFIENPDKVQYEKFENADHGLSFLEDQKRYESIIKKWIFEQ